MKESSRRTLTVGAATAALVGVLLPMGCTMTQTPPKAPPPPPPSGSAPAYGAPVVPPQTDE